MAGRAKADGGAGGGMTRPAKAANGCLPWMLGVGIRLCYPVSAPWARLSTASGAIKPIFGVLMYIKNIIIL
ncbi:hypothetical protein CIK92_07970 [Prevotella sp. P4-67]|nr:hypothetical protein CIK92_07970 [Prevotella sp. P4-67]